MSTSSDLPGDIVAALGDDLTGEIVLPGDDRFEERATPFYAGFDQRPAVVVRPVDAADVARVVTAARTTGAELAVRSGGHSLAGHSATNGGILLDLGAMRALELDLESRTAWAETGLTTGEYTQAAGAHGLATPFGDTGSVGLGGITLGGGAGFLARKHGLTIDSLLAAELVTADGEIVEVDDDRHPDLFWAIRGGGGNFGVATRFRFALHEVSSVVGGMLVLPATAEVAAAVVAHARSAEDELSTIVNVMTAPPMPFLPEEMVGRPVVLVLMAYAGDGDAGFRHVETLRRVAEPLFEQVGEIPYTGLFPPEQEFHPAAANHNLFVDRFDTAMAETALAALDTSTAMISAVQVRVLGGAVARVPIDATAYPHRDREIMVNIGALSGEVADIPVHTAWVEELAASLGDGDGASYVNFMGALSPDRLRRAYSPATWDRLVEVKRRYDPGNLFRRNQNIPPG